MKKLFVLLSILISSIGYSQMKYEMYSDIWDLTYVDGKYKITPKGGGNFDFAFDYVQENIDEDEIRKYILDEFIKFRLNYGVYSKVIESEKLTKKADEWADYISPSNLVHTKDGSNIKDVNEVCISYSFVMYSKIKPEDGNLNKIIASSIFDTFVQSPAHMKILLIDVENIKFGFGIDILNTGMDIVIQNSTTI